MGAEHSSPPYHASKGAVRLQAVAIQHAQEGTRVNSVHAGPIVTPLTAAGRADPERYRHMLARIPMGRYGQPDEVAYGVLYLASDESSFVVIDGGWTAQ